MIGGNATAEMSSLLCVAKKVPWLLVEELAALVNLTHLNEATALQTCPCGSFEETPGGQTQFVARQEVIVVVVFVNPTSKTK